MVTEPERKIITELSEPEIAMLTEVRDEWVGYGLSTQPADRAAAEEGVRMAYEAASLEPPKVILWFDSPWAAALAQAVAPEVLTASAAVNRKISTVLGDVERDALPAQLIRMLSPDPQERTASSPAGPELVRLIADALNAEAAENQTEDDQEITARQQIVAAGHYARSQGQVTLPPDRDFTDLLEASGVAQRLGEYITNGVDETLRVTDLASATRAVYKQVIDEAVQAAFPPVSVEKLVTGVPTTAMLADLQGIDLRSDAHKLLLQNTYRAVSGLLLQHAYRTQESLDEETRSTALRQQFADLEEAVTRSASAVDATQQPSSKVSIPVSLVENPLRAAIRDVIETQINTFPRVDDRVDAQVLRKQRERLSNWWQGRLMGPHWGGYYSYYDAMMRLGVTGLEPLRGAQQVAKSAGWWWAFTEYAAITDRPAELHRDEQGRLHGETGMAIRYRDGWGFHCWHGTRVPAWVVENPTVDLILAEENQEIRRCAIENLGWDQFLISANLRAVDECDDPGNPGFRLGLYDVPRQLFAEPVRILLCTNGSLERDGTRRRFGLTVPATCTSALEAAAWGYGMTADQYKRVQVRR